MGAAATAPCDNELEAENNATSLRLEAGVSSPTPMLLDEVEVVAKLEWCAAEEVEGAAREASEPLDCAGVFGTVGAEDGGGAGASMNDDRFGEACAELDPPALRLAVFGVGCSPAMPVVTKLIPFCEHTSCTMLIMFCLEKGLDTKRDMPAAAHLLRSSMNALAVSATIGTGGR